MPNSVIFVGFNCPIQLDQEIESLNELCKSELSPSLYNPKFTESVKNLPFKK